MIIKVCGMRDADNIRQIDELGCVDWMGFIFYPRSSRFVSEVPSYLPRHCQRVGVFVNANHEEIQQRQTVFAFNLIQLHGNETPEYVQTLREKIGNEMKIIKMIQVSSLEDLDSTLPYEKVVDYFLFETKYKGYGGSGKQFDWEILQHYKGQTPFLLTGGISPDDAEKVKAFHHPLFAGIDLNSRFETAPALKDIKLIKEFINKIK